MKLRAVPTIELTPEARIHAAKKKLGEAIAEMIGAFIAQGVAATEWVDQNSSPLGKERHLRLVRLGVLKGVQEGRRRLVRRADIHAYLSQHPTIAKTAPAAEDLSVQEMMDRLAGGM